MPRMVAMQRLFAIVMMGAMVFVFLVPLALKQHAYPVAIGMSAVYVAYLAVNVWLWTRARR